MREPEFIREERTKNPLLRAIGNTASLISSWALLKYVYAEEDNKKVKQFIYITIFHLYYPLSRWSTVYVMNIKGTDEDDQLD